MKLGLEPDFSAPLHTMASHSVWVLEGCMCVHVRVLYRGVCRAVCASACEQGCVWRGMCAHSYTGQSHKFSQTLGLQGAVPM